VDFVFHLTYLGISSKNPVCAMFLPAIAYLCSLYRSNQMSEKAKNELPIGIFDSGVGGLTVYRALHDRLPNEHFIYLGDTARVPYGTKSLSTVERYALENSQFLVRRGIKMLVVACNTASALALPAIRAAIGLDVVGVIGPGGRKAVEITKCDDPKIGVIATGGHRCEQRICRGDPTRV
jgi:glutamate racemase